MQDKEASKLKLYPFIYKDQRALPPVEILMMWGPAMGESNHILLIL